MNTQALKEITVNEYNDLAQNGARTLFDIGMFRVMDGLKDEKQSHFVRDYVGDRWFLIDMTTCYELVTAFHCGGYKPYIEECLNEIICSVD